MKEQLTLDDARLAARLAKTLDQAAAQPDPVWDQRMEQILAQASLPRSHSHRWQWGGLALAASVTFMVALPGGWLLPTSSTSGAQNPEAIEGQMLEEIDWLMVMEEASRDAR